MIESLLKSRRFWVAAAAIACVLLKDKLPLSEAQINDLVLAIGAWIVGESLRSSQAVHPPA